MIVAASDAAANKLATLIYADLEYAHYAVALAATHSDPLLPARMSIERLLVLQR